jgi:hypothetical protein
MSLQGDSIDPITKSASTPRGAHVVAYKGRLYVGTTNRTQDGLSIIEPPDALAGDVGGVELGVAVRRAFNASKTVPNIDFRGPELKQRTADLVRAYGAKSITAVYRECAACYVDVRDGRLVVMPQAFDGGRMLIELEESARSFESDPDDMQLGVAVKAALEESARERG